MMTQPLSWWRATLTRFVPELVVAYMLLLFLLTIVLLPLVPLTLLWTYLRDGSLDLPGLDGEGKL